MITITQIDDFLKSIEKYGVDLITLHWTVGYPNQLFNDDYHFQIMSEGTIHVDSRAFLDGVFVPLAHAWHHNSYNIGISICGMLGAQDCGYGSSDLVNWPKFYGDYPPTPNQIETLCTLTAKLLKHYGLGLSQVKTHYELAQEDGYPGERWEYRYEKQLLLDKIKEKL